MIIPIKLKLSNAYLVIGKQPILIDTGSPGEAHKLISALKRADVSLENLSLILHTHGHSDHVGSTQALHHYTSAPTAIHPADLALAERGNNGKLTGIGWQGRLIKHFFNHTTFPSFSPTVHLADKMRLDSYGVAAQVIHTPGHTKGSISILFDSGEAIIGDLLMGGYLGGNMFPSKPNYHYFAEDFSEIHPSLKRILLYNPTCLYVGHGGPLSSDAVQQRFMKQGLVRAI